jgi:hypothetical protein
LRKRKSFFPLVSAVTSLSGGQSPMLYVFDTILVLGSKSWSSFNVGAYAPRTIDLRGGDHDRPWPQHRSYTTSDFFISASFSII